MYHQNRELSSCTVPECTERTFFTATGRFCWSLEAFVQGSQQISILPDTRSVILKIFDGADEHLLVGSACRRCDTVAWSLGGSASLAAMRCRNLSNAADLVRFKVEARHSFSPAAWHSAIARRWTTTLGLIEPLCAFRGAGT